MEYFLGVTAAFLLGAGTVLQQLVAQDAPQVHYLRLSLIGDLLRRPLWLAGVGLAVAGELLAAWVLGHVVLSLAEPLLASSLLFALALAAPVSGQALRRSEIAGALLLICGVSALSVSRSLSSAQVSVGRPAYRPAAGAVAALAAYGLARLGQRRTGDLRATLTGASAGVLFGVQDALIRQTVLTADSRRLIGLFVTWPGYCLVPVGLIGLWLLQSAFTAAPLHASLPATTAAEPVTGMALGVVVFGDVLRVSPGVVVLQSAGLLALLAGVIMVARAPALTGLRGARPLAIRGRQNRRDRRDRRDDDERPQKPAG